MNMFLRRLCLSVIVSVVVSTAGAQETSNMSPDNDARMKWWRDAKFGMFIHWGVYAVPAGTYNGKQIPGIGEWIMLRGRIPVAEYRAYAQQFNPVKYEPKEWAKLAKQAGMKYIVITAKHHDGFALFPSDATEWDIADASPYKKDLITPLAKATRNQGLKFGTYYSQSQDWTHPGGAKSGLKEGEGWDEAHKGSYDDYLKNIAVPQTREILMRIQPDILWWDTPMHMTQERVQPLHDLLPLRPGLITNNRLGANFPGDTETPEQFIPATGFKNRDWETCMTMNDTWGFKSYDHNWKSTDTLIRNLVDIVSKGGNYLLNVGPTEDGEIPEPSVQRLKQIGAWMKVNGDAIYGTTASPFWRLTWGRCTKKVNEKGGTLYLHVFDWPGDGKLTVPGLRSKVTKARLLANRGKVGVSAEGNDVVLQLPAKAPDAIVSVIALEFDGPLEVDRILPTAEPGGKLVLRAEIADIHNSLSAHARLQGRGSEARIANWNSYQSRVSWDFNATKTGAYRVTADISGTGGGKLNVSVGGKAVTAEVASAESAGTRTVELGTVSIPAPGTHTIELKPQRTDWKGFELRSLTLTSVAE